MQSPAYGARERAGKPPLEAAPRPVRLAAPAFSENPRPVRRRQFFSLKEGGGSDTIKNSLVGCKASRFLFFCGSACFDRQRNHRFKR